MTTTDFSSLETARVQRIIDRRSTVLNCFDNVDRKVAESGGSLVVGWAILRCGVYAEANHHAVWQSPDGSLFDITPEFVGLYGETVASIHSEGEIEFLADAEASFEGVPRLNRYFPLFDCRHLLRGCEFVAESDRKFYVSGDYFAGLYYTKRAEREFHRSRFATYPVQLNIPPQLMIEKSVRQARAEGDDLLGGQNNAC